MEKKAQPVPCDDVHDNMRDFVGITNGDLFFESETMSIRHLHKSKSLHIWVRQAKYIWELEMRTDI